jgi:hypothetical protein
MFSGIKSLLFNLVGLLALNLLVLLSEVDYFFSLLFLLSGNKESIIVEV